MPAGLKLRSAKVVGVRFVCCDVVARSCGLATLLRSRGVANFVGCGVAESRRWVVAESRRCGAAVVSRRCSVVAVWSQCGRGVVTVWCGCGCCGVVESRSCGIAELSLAEVADGVMVRGVVAAVLRRCCRQTNLTWHLTPHISSSLLV